MIYQAKSSAYEELVKFWGGYAIDENQHAKWLADLRARLTPDQLALPVDAEIAEKVEAVSQVSVEKILESINNLEDAYQVVNEVEGAETNTIFNFLIDTFEPDPKTLTFLITQLNSHIGKLTFSFPVKFHARLNARRFWW